MTFHIHPIVYYSHTYQSLSVSFPVVAGGTALILAASVAPALLQASLGMIGIGKWLIIIQYDTKFRLHLANFEYFATKQI